MKYQIVNFDELTAQVTLQVDGFPLFVVDLPIDENQNVPTGTELEAYLKGFIPTWHKERQDKLSKGIANASEIAKLVTPLPIVEPSLDEMALQIRAERNRMLLESDWTQLPDTNLADIEKQLWIERRQSLRDITKQAGFPTSVVYPSEVV